MFLFRRDEVVQLVPMSLSASCGLQTPNGIIFSSGTNIIEGKAQEHTRTHKLKHTRDKSPEAERRLR